MSELFQHFFRGLWGHDPFPWQAMLAQRVVEAGWPDAIRHRGQEHPNK